MDRHLLALINLEMTVKLQKQLLDIMEVMIENLKEDIEQQKKKRKGVV